jgi:small conductance mechanosensitive channel
MTALYALLTLMSFQVAQAGPLVGADPAESAPDRTALPQLLAQAQPGPALPRATDAKAAALEKFHAFDFTALTADEWSHVAIYYGLRAAFVVILLMVALTASSWASTALEVTLTRVRFDRTLTLFVSRLLRWLILLLVALTCLSYFGVQTTSFAAVIGAAGLAIALAFQGTLSNFAAGAMLLIFRPYKVGDVVNVAGNLGIVGEIELLTTTIDTFDRRRIFVPNSSIYGAVIENITYHPVRRADVAVGVAYAADVDETRAALERAVRSVPDAVADPAPEIVLVGLGASSVDWMVRAFARRDNFGKVKEAVIRAVKLELDRSGIAIPFPQLDVHIEQQSIATGQVA